MSVLLDRARAGAERFATELAELVAVDSGSRDRAGVTAVADLLVPRLDALGMTVERLPGEPVDGEVLGDVVVAHHRGAPGAPRVLLLGHLDTVFSRGEAARRPFSVAGTTAHGPGVCDDKGGVLAGIHALEALAAARALDGLDVTLVLAPDEELGSRAGRGHIEAAGRAADVVLGLECARENGDCVSARRGLAELEAVVHGRAAHAGIEPERGIDAALGAARLALDLVAAVRATQDAVTINVGVLEAGEAINVVAPVGRVGFELRGSDPDAFARALAVVEDVCAREPVPGARVHLRRITEHPPWQRDAAGARLADRARALAADLGLDLHDAATGGTGDVNLVAALGVPALDGLGPVGGGDHGEDEWLDLASVPQRVALLAALVADVGGFAPDG